MPLVGRAPRPLARDKQHFRDDRLFVVACDDTYAPKQYFDAFRIARVQVHVVPTTDGTSAAQHVLTRVEEFKKTLEDDDELWMLLDTDHSVDGSHRHSFLQAIQSAKQQGIGVAVSRPCFEFWLLLHLTDDVGRLRALTDARMAAAAMTEILETYNKTNLDITQYSSARLHQACRLGASIDAETTGGDAPDSPTSRVYLLWAALLSKASQTQLDENLIALRRFFMKEAP